MATNFPGGVDVFTDPAPTTAMNNVAQPHSAMHDTANDGLVAVQLQHLAVPYLLGAR